MHFDAELAHIFADARTGLHNRLVHLAFYLLQDGGRNFIDDLHHVRTQITGCRVNDLEFFLDTDGEAVSHSWPSGWLACTIARLASAKASARTGDVAGIIPSRCFVAQSVSASADSQDDLIEVLAATP